MIPNIIHFIYGLKPDFGGKEFCLVHYLAIKSAYEVNKPDEMYLYYAYEPSNNKWWDHAKKMVNLEKIESPEFIFGNKLHHVAHQADVVRLNKIIKRGGIYLDIDTICVKPFHPLRDNKFVMGYEKNNGKTVGLCNAVMLSERGAKFPNTWLETYKSFRSKGNDNYWAEHSVHVPYKLYKEEASLKSEIHIEPQSSFFNPAYSDNGLKDFFLKNKKYENAYCHHLWESFTYERYIKKIDINFIKTVNTAYCNIARKFI